MKNVSIKWPFDKIIKMLTYKARVKGIRVVKEPEDYTSQTCCICGTICKYNRVHRGLYVCKQCGAIRNETPAFFMRSPVA